MPGSRLQRANVLICFGDRRRVGSLLGLRGVSEQWLRILWRSTCRKLGKWRRQLGAEISTRRAVRDGSARSGLRPCNAAEQGA